MKIFTKFGDLIFRFFYFLGMLIQEIPKIPEKLRNMSSGGMKGNTVTKIKKNISEISTNKVPINSKSAESGHSPSEKLKTKKGPKTQDSDTILISAKFSSEAKERTILELQILSAAFIVISILYLFNFLNFFLYLLIGIIIVAYVLYLIFKKVKLMYYKDFNAYRDFFLMYIAVGIILVIVSSNTNFINAFSFGFLPSLSVLILAMILVIGFFLVFRIRYHRNFTYGTVIEAGKKTAHVKVEYDIRSNVKPDLYIVENQIGANDGDQVKLRTEGKILSGSGNKPISIIETVRTI